MHGLAIGELFHALVSPLIVSLFAAVLLYNTIAGKSYDRTSTPVSKFSTLIPYFCDIEYFQLKPTCEFILKSAPKSAYSLITWTLGAISLALAITVRVSALSKDVVETISHTPIPGQDCERFMKHPLSYSQAMNQY